MQIDFIYFLGEEGKELLAGFPHVAILPLASQTARTPGMSSELRMTQDPNPRLSGSSSSTQQHPTAYTTIAGPKSDNSEKQSC